MARPEVSDPAIGERGLVTIARTAELATTTAAIIARALPLRPGRIDGQSASIDGTAVECLDGFLRLFIGAHGHKSEAARTAGSPVHHQIGFNDGAVSCEHILQVIFGGFEGEISNVKFIHNDFLLSYRFFQTVPDCRV